MINQAITTLSKNTIFNIDMLEPIKRGHAKVVYADDKTVLIHEERSSAYMMYSENIPKGIALLESELPKNANLLCLHQEELVDFAKRKFFLNTTITCYQTANLSRQLITLSDSLKIKVLDSSFKETIHEYYKVYSIEKLHILLNEHHIFGGFLDDKLVGFIGLHLEGSCGLLFILPEYRNNGYGSLLEQFLNNHIIHKGWTPFGQVEDTNHKSLALQKKLGMDVSEEKIYWLF
ncbi:MAG: GNAT family N-acetyltransferase [Filifactoraceae bacterium]